MDSFEAALKTLVLAGATIVDNPNFQGAKELKNLKAQVKNIFQLSKLKEDAFRCLTGSGNDPSNPQNAQRVYDTVRRRQSEEPIEREFNKILCTRTTCIPADDEEYTKILEKALIIAKHQGISATMRKHHFDMFVIPSSDEDMTLELVAQENAPVMSVPLGYFPDGFQPWRVNIPMKSALKDRKYDSTKIEMSYSNYLLHVNIFCCSSEVQSPVDKALWPVAHAFEQLTAVRGQEPGPRRPLPKTELIDVQPLIGDMSELQIDRTEKPVPVSPFLS
jgi:hypothetical protein